ncbi:MAG: 6-phospho-3-hexuloisomerase [Armatimonadota bacterium]
MHLGEECADVAAEAVAALANCPEQAAEDVLAAILRADRVFLTGQGRTGLIARAFAQRLMQLGLRCFVVGDTTTPAIGRSDVLVACSGSGETSLTLKLVEQAKGLGATVVAVVGRADCSLADLADVAAVITDPRQDASDDSILPLGSRFELALFVFLEVLLLRLMRRLRVSEADMRSRHANLE